jgi:Fe2+ transport system protein FeoA
VINEAPGRSLAEVGAGERVQVLRVAEDEDVLGYLGARGLVPGVLVEVLERDTVGGLLALEVGEGSTVLTLEVARHVTVADR